MHFISVVFIMLIDMNNSEVQQFCTAISTFAWENDYSQFCEVCGFNRDFYSEQKWQEFKELNKLLSKFDNSTMTRMVRTGLKLSLNENEVVQY